MINNAQVYCVFLGDWTSAANQTRATRLQQFLRDLLNSSYMNILSQYGCGTTGNLVNSVFVASSNHNLSGADVHNVFQTAINNNQIPEPTNPSNVYILFLDDATAVDDAGTGAVMCEATSDSAFGYHFFFTTTAGNPLPFAVVPGLSDTCVQDSCPGGDSTCSLKLTQTQEQRQTQVLSHEFSEMLTDPQPFTGWTDLFAGENGDLCNGQPGTITVGANTWNVQLMYSKWDDMNSGGATTCIGGPANPIPSLLPSCSFIMERSTIGQDEIDALGGGAPPRSKHAVVHDAFRVVVDGLTASQLSLTGTGSTLAVSSPTGGMKIICTGNVSATGDYGGEIQRFTFSYDIDFGLDDSAFSFAADSELLTLNVTAGCPNVKASAQIELIKQPNPYILHGDIAWLSIDLRVFVVKANETRFGVAMGADANSAPGFIQQVMGALTAGAGSAGGETYEGLSTDEASSALYVYPTDGGGTKVFNFALARVRYRGQLLGASNVRLFFRLFQAQSTTAAFDPSTTYRRASSNPSGQPISLAGIQGGEYVTIPCFASHRVDTTKKSMAHQTDDPNVQSFGATGGPEVDRYYGAWLDVNQPFKPNGDPNNVLPATVPATNVDGPFKDPSNPPLTIEQAILRSPHQCVVAEIAFDPVPIPVGKDPGNWDKLAQRNIAWSDLANPGVDGSRRALTTFEIRPTPEGTSTPDELMVDWETVPKGSQATFYLPAVSAYDVVALADKMYAIHSLTAADDHTVACPTGRVTYIPIPPGGTVNHTGLLSVDFPGVVRHGELYAVRVRQVTNASGQIRTKPPQPPPPASTKHAPSLAPAKEVSEIHWRRTLGAFQLVIPVHTKATLLRPEERLLSVMRWIGEAIPTSSRWYPVFKRYLDGIVARVVGFGGDPSTIPPTPTGEWHVGRPGGEGGEERIPFSGKVEGLIYDRFGDFEGFIVDTEDGDRMFWSREREVEELVRRSWADRIPITVKVESDDPHRPLTIILRAPPPEKER